ncbi:MAG: bifunctional phosphoglucose/phosphomannose isomerase [Dehalococcoidia bacterium]|nr:bifunctional phosphoglucose/phosphomannose isomerase [Dehalococcoidia bacterium]
MSRLDDTTLLALDADGMLGHIRVLGDELARAWEASEAYELPAAAGSATSVVIAGMGGSATAGDYLAALSATSAEIPVTVVRGYSLPNYVSDRTLVILSSYSGNTEESLSCYDDAWKRGATIVATTTGGQLAERARRDGVPVWPINYQSAPRAALGHSLAPLLRIGARVGLCAVDSDAIARVREQHRALVQQFVPETPAANNPAKQLAEALHGRVPFVIGAEHLASVASRFKNQVAENGKSLAAADVLPEANHNLVVGLGTGAKGGESVSLVTLESERLYDARVQKRFDVTAQIFEEEGVPLHRLSIEGDSTLSEILLGTAWGDYVSVYLALLNGVDPGPVPQIVRLKAALERLGG